MRRDLVAEVLLVLDDPGDVESAATAAGDLDRVGGALVGVDPPEEQKMLAGARMDREPVDIDAVVDGGGVVQIRVSIGVADRHVRGSAVVALVDRTIQSDENPWIVVTTGVVTRSLYVSGRKSNPLWMMSNSLARSNTEAMCRHSATLVSIVSSSDQPDGAVACSLAVVIESAVANSVT